MDERALALSCTPMGSRPTWPVGVGSVSSTNPSSSSSRTMLVTVDGLRPVI